VSRPARRLLSRIALALALAGLVALGAPTAAVAGDEVPRPVAPTAGAVLTSTSVVLEWTDVAADGYQVSWASTPGGDVTGLATATVTTMTVAVDAGSYEWRVRALPDGEWSAPATFLVDLDLPTLGLPEDGSATPVVAARGSDDVPGGVWIAGAVGFAVLFLGVVVVQARRQREREA
jgi:hypothetical protein